MPVLPRKYLAIVLVLLLQSLITILSGMVFSDEFSSKAIVLNQNKKVVISKINLPGNVIGQATTVFNTEDADRLNNIRLAVYAINGRKIAPGEVFSFNEVVGERSKEKGYSNATTIINGSLDKEVGGGVCQVATTLYQAVLNAGLKIVERYPHSILPFYSPNGIDATVVYGMMDFKFKNSCSKPIYIKIKLENGKLTISLLSQENNKNKIFVEGVDITPRGVNNSRRIRVERVVYDMDGNMQTEFISEDNYAVIDATIK